MGSVEKNLEKGRDFSIDQAIGSGVSERTSTAFHRPRLS